MNAHRAFRLGLVACIAAFSGAAAAQQDISGTWQGKLAVAPGSEMTIRFVFSRSPDGSYAAVVTSPDQGAVKDVPASSVSFDGSRLRLAIDSLNGAYDGRLENGTITGEWTQEGAALPLAVTRYEGPTLSPESKELLAGDWIGQLESPVGKLTIVLEFESAPDGAFSAFISSPDQGPGRMQTTDIELADGSLTIRLPARRLVYTAKVTADEIAGTWSQGIDMPLTLKRGTYAPTIADLALPSEAFAQLAGTWRGKIAQLNIVVRFEKAPGGEQVAFLDSPDQGASGIPITEAALTDGRLTFRVPGVAGNYAGTVSGNEIAGEWTQPGVTNPLTLTRE